MQVRPYPLNPVSELDRACKLLIEQAASLAGLFAIQDGYLLFARDLEPETMNEMISIARENICHPC